MMNTDDVMIHKFEDELTGEACAIVLRDGMEVCVSLEDGEEVCILPESVNRVDSREEKDPEEKYWDDCATWNERHCDDMDEGYYD